jgi:hypothetical protein
MPICNAIQLKVVQVLRAENKHPRPLVHVPYQRIQYSAAKLQHI